MKRVIALGAGLLILILIGSDSAAQNIINPSATFISQTGSIFPDTGIRIDHPGEAINTPYSEFAAYQVADHSLYFSALRPYKVEAEHGFIPDDFYTQLYISKIGPGGWNSAELAPRRLNSGKYHIANACLSQQGDRIWFTRCSEDVEGRKQCRIVESQLNSRGRWTRPKTLPETVNQAAWSSTQPFVYSGPDVELLFFSSDRPGGIGGYDIWYCRISDGEYGTAVNLGSIINTKGNEHSPFYFDGRLYFSSDSLPGLGGFDIFESQGLFNSWSRPLNPGAPLNSPFDDLNFSINADSLSGYFTSNRPGSLHIYEETCCYDIYHAEWDPTPEPVRAESEIEIRTDSLARLLLPISLYFDNDQPDPRSRAETTRANYLDLLTAYSAEQGRYRSEYSKGLIREKAIAAESEIDLFFDSLVMGGFEKLELLAGYILNDLQAGESVRIKVSGFASPLNTSEYNFNLSRRRIASLMNFLMSYNDSILSPYFGNKGTEPELIIESVPVGENRSKAYVSDNPNDVRNSVYSMAAALERRIEINSYESGRTLQTPDSYGQITFLDATTSFEGISGRNIIASLPFINSGSHPIIIQGVSSQNPGIQISYPDMEIDSGQKGIIYLLIAADVPGEYAGDLKIEFTPSEQSIVLHLRWNFKSP